MTIKTFLSDESGAVTVDWVVLTAALVGLGLAVMAVVNAGVADLTGDVDTKLSNNSIITTSFRGTQSADFGSACAAAGNCDGYLYGSDEIAGLGISELSDEVTAYNAGVGDGSITTVAGVTTGYTQDDAGTWFNDTDGTELDAGVLATAAANDAYGAALNAEQGVRATQNRD